MSSLNRRDFLKALGLTTGTSAVVSACGLDQNYYRTPIETVHPYVVLPDTIIPGVPAFFATTATTGPAAHPVTARHRDGRAINVGANPQAPNAKGVPSAAMLELQRLYTPDRVKAPAQGGKDVSWDDALSALAGAVKAAREGGKKVAWLGPYRSGAAVELINDYTGGEAVFWEPGGREAEANAAEKLFGRRVLPAYDLSKARYVLSFGADFLGTWGSADHAGAYAFARNPNVNGGHVVRFGLVTPHRGQTGANADDWFAAAPGTEALVALAVAKIVAEKAGYSGPLSGLVAAGDAKTAAAASGLTEEQIQGIAAQFSAGPAVALPGGAVGATRAATDLAIAVFALNVVSGNAGVTFGDGPVYAGPVHGGDRLKALIDAMAAGSVDVLLIDDHANPAYALPAAAGFAAAVAKVKLVVSLSSFRSETAALAGLVLPVAAALEDWGDEEPAAGLHLLRQPSMTPLYNNRSFGDVLLATAKAAGIQASVGSSNVAANADPAAAAAVAPAAPVAAAGLGFAPENWRTYLQRRWERDVFPKAGGGLAFADFWNASLGRGFADARAPIAPFADVRGDATVGGAAAFEGDGPYHLIAYPHPFRADGRYANEPWAQETPDPMTGNVWDSWIEIHPETADALGLKNNDLVELSTPTGKIELGVTRYRGIHKGAVAVAFGQGHTASGRYADGIGQNVVALLGMMQDGAGAVAWQHAKAKVTPLGRPAALVSTFGAEDDFKRDIGVYVPAEDFAKVGDKADPHPGSLTGLHYLELDKRLLEKGITDFYPMPDHPTYRFGLTVDVNACNGCGVCAIACYAENNLPVVGKQKVREGREMGWIRVGKYQAEGDDQVRFVPMMCQQCGHAPCESVCPVLATYHTIDGLNAMVYNRCVGTRYCSNNCPYKARRFNWHSYVWPEPFNLQLNPDVSTRTMGVMEKCTFCVQRIRAVKTAYRNQSIRDGQGYKNVVPEEALHQLPACAEACPSQALSFGNINNPESIPAKTRQSGRNYEVFADLHVFSAVNYLGKASFHHKLAHHGGGGEHAAGGEHGGEHGAGSAHAPAEGGHAAPAGEAGHAPAEGGHAPAEGGHAPAGGGHAPADPGHAPGTAAPAGEGASTPAHN